MHRRTHLLAVLLAFLLATVALGDEEADRERFRELKSEFRAVANGVAWSDVKRRRDLLREISLLETEVALPLLWESFTGDRENQCRLQAMRGVAVLGPTIVRKRLVTTALRNRNDLFTLALPRAFEGVEDPELARWLAEKVLPGRRSADERAAVLVTLGHLRSPDVFETVAEEIEGEKREPRIVREALIALARIDGAKAVPRIAARLESDSEVARESAVLALGATGRSEEAGRLVLLANDRSSRVRDAVAATIGDLDPEIALPVLIGLLRCDRLRVIGTALQSLEKLTGEDFGLDPAAWAHWYANRGKEDPRPKPAPGEPATVPTFYGLRVLSDRVLFVVDVSGSMSTGRPPRIETARRELARTLAGLAPETQFDVVAFSGSPMWWRDDLTEASPANVAAAEEFVGKLTAGGGTNVHDTLFSALEEHPRVDTIFFLGDGSPSAGRVTDQAEILARIGWMTRLRRVRIHTIALLPAPELLGGATDVKRDEDPDEAARFMARLAAETGGTFLRLTR